MLLRKFYFDTYKNVVKGVYKKSKSSWFLFDSRRSSDLLLKTKSTEGKLNLTNEETNKIKKLKQYSLHFFTNNSIYQLAWFNRPFPAEFEKKKIYTLKDVDLLCKVLSLVKCYFDDGFYHKIIFIDKEGRQYYSELKNMSLDIELD